MADFLTVTELIRENAYLRTLRDRWSVGFERLRRLDLPGGDEPDANLSAMAADEIERLRALVQRVAQVDPRWVDDSDYAVCTFCNGGQLERDEQPEPGRIVTDHHDEWTYGGHRDAIIWTPARTYSRLVRIEHETDCPWLACRQESPC